VSQLTLDGLGPMTDKKLGRVKLVTAVRRDFADLAATDEHAGVAAAAEAAARSAWQLLESGAPGGTRALAELRAWYVTADELRRSTGLATVDPVAQLLASIPDTPAGLT
jgi:hypothetical protein